MHKNIHTFFIFHPPINRQYTNIPIHQYTVRNCASCSTLYLLLTTHCTQGVHP